MIQVDEDKLDPVGRLGLAWCRLNCGEWDKLLGDKPEGFDKLPMMTRKRFFGKKKPCKYDVVRPMMMAIESIIGEAYTSLYWWVFKLGRTKEEWFEWYLTERFQIRSQKNSQPFLNPVDCVPERL